MFTSLYFRICLIRQIRAIVDKFGHTHPVIPLGYLESIIRSRSLSLLPFVDVLLVSRKVQIIEPTDHVIISILKENHLNKIVFTNLPISVQSIMEEGISTVGSCGTLVI